MRILHTSDWHIGRSFHGTGMLETQAEAIGQIVQHIKEQNIELVLISGDVYDRALPPVHAVELLDRALSDIRDAGAEVVISSGNHDSATRLGFGRALMRSSGVHLRTSVDEMTVPYLRTDEKSGSQIVVWGIPFIEPRNVAELWEVDSNHTAVITEAVKRIQKARSELEADGVIDAHDAVHIVMAHLFAAGGAGSESERDIGQGEIVGGLGQVPARVFEDFDYAALGHLHGRQKLTETVRYSGSPVSYSFSEARHIKGAWMLETESGSITKIQKIDISAGKPLAVLSGTLEDLLDNPDYDYAEQAWCQITVTNEQRPPKAYQRVKERFPGLLNFIVKATHGGSSGGTNYSAKLKSAKSDLHLCTDFIDHVRNRPVSDSERAYLRQALQDIRISDSEAGIK